MADPRTTRIYERHAEEWANARVPNHLEAVAWINEQRQAGPIADIGCGPGWHLAACHDPAVGIDVARAMLALALHQTSHALIQGSADRLPFAPRSLGGAIATRVYNHLPLVENPMALADLHRCLQADAPVLFQFFAHRREPTGTTDRAEVWGRDRRSTGPFDGRLNSAWTESGLSDLLLGAGFDVAHSAVDEHGCRTVLATKAFSLPDTVGPDMKLLICGLNPSPSSSERGVGFGRPGNRFWPAAQAAELITADRDPSHAYHKHRIGMTDLVKRTTRRADELGKGEYREGLGRVERLVRWLQPQAVCFVGLAGWRAAMGRRAAPGLQEHEVGNRPVYVMPSTSGLNASSQLADLTEHLRAAAALAEEQDTTSKPGKTP